jgi:N-acetylglucosamine kinase-like BadF-type ATPase
VSDADLILPAADLRDGVAVVAGTGAVAVGRRGPDDVKAGGWGYLLGDEGSGYWLVRAAVRQLLRGHERGDRPTPLLAALLDSTGTRDLAQLVQHLYHSPRPASWARHAPAVLDSAGTDPAAQTVLDGAADALAGIALSSVRRLGGDLPVVLAGGILTNHAMLADAVHARLSTTEVAEVSTLLAEPVAGAVKLAAALVTADGDTTQ